MDKPISSLVPEDKPLDLALFDNAMFLPLGLRDLKAPVVVLLHDNECTYDYFDQIASEIDLVCLGSSSEILENGRAFGVPTTTYFFPFHMTLPEYDSLSAVFSDSADRDMELFYSGSISHDLYHYKKQQILSLAGLSKDFKIEIKEGFLPFGRAMAKTAQGSLFHYVVPHLQFYRKPGHRGDCNWNYSSRRRRGRHTLSF